MENNQALTNHWNVLYVYSRCEKKVSHCLTEMGFTTLVPTQIQRKRWSDRWKKQEVILFKNYVFVKTNRRNKNRVFHAGSIYRYVQFEGQPATVSPREIQLIQNIGKANQPVEIACESFHVGEQVEITNGPLAGHQATITRCQGSRKLLLHLPNLHCFAKVELADVAVRRV